MKRILIVEDEPIIKHMLTKRLARESYEVLTADNGEDGLVKAKRYDPQVILLDLWMPKMGGIEFLQQFSPTKKIPHSVIVLTAHGNTDDKRQCYELGVQAFLNKPPDLYELLGLIKRSFELNYYVKELQTQKNLLQNTFESMAEGVIQLDGHYFIQMISPKACHILGIDLQAALHKPASTILGPSVVGPSGVITSDNPSQSGLNNLQTELLSPSGAIIPILLSLVPLKNTPQGGWLLLFQDLRTTERSFRQQSKNISFGRMVSCNPQMLKIFDLIDKVATSHAAVLIQGESGTGKELVAKEIHSRSDRAQGPLHSVNCAAISPNLLESEFFGHERGAFSNALRQKPGRFELAHQGTLFLDEVGEIPLELQGKLLRALQEQVFERVGGTELIQVDVRIIAATNQNLEQMVREKKFREDLYYRLNVINIHLPPLRERREDIPLLIKSLIGVMNRQDQRSVQGVDSLFFPKLLNYPWPGNIRELLHSLEHAFAVSQGMMLHAEDFPEIIQEKTSEIAPPPQDEKQLILRALAQTNYHKGKAASLLGIHRGSLSRKLKRYGI